MQHEVISTTKSLDFANQAELEKQAGHSRENWPSLIVKELLDNALDAAEDIGVPPVVEIKATANRISVADNGCSMPPEVVRRLANFESRTSSREAVIELQRGAQGNASLIIESCGLRHVMTAAIDSITSEPGVKHVEEPSFQQFGTRVFIVSSWLRNEDSQIVGTARNIAAVKPAASIRINGQELMEPVKPAKPRWHNGKAPSPHWYTEEQLYRLVQAKLSVDRERPVRDLLETFDGMKRDDRRKEVTDATGLTRKPLSAILDDKGAICEQSLRSLHTTLCEAT